MDSNRKLDSKTDDSQIMEEAKREEQRLARYYYCSYIQSRSYYDEPFPDALFSSISKEDQEKYKIKSTVWDRIRHRDLYRVLGEAMWDARDNSETIRKYVAANSCTASLLRMAIQLMPVDNDSAWGKWAGMRLIDYAMVNLNYEVLKILIEQAKFPLTFLHFGLCVKNNEFSTFLAYPLNPAHGDSDKRIAIVRLLLNNGVNPNHPLHVVDYLFLSLENSNPKFAELLLLNGANPNIKYKGKLFIDCAIQRDWPVVVRLAVMNGVSLNHEIESGDWKGRTVKKYLESHGDKFDTEIRKTTASILTTLSVVNATTHTIASQQAENAAAATQRFQLLDSKIEGVSEEMTGTRGVTKLTQEFIMAESAEKVARACAALQNSKFK